VNLRLLAGIGAPRQYQVNKPALTVPDKYFIKAQYHVISVKQDSNQQRLGTIQMVAAQL